MSDDPRKYCTFFVEDHCFGVDVNQVQELIPSQTIKPIPHAPLIVRGLINLRGQIVTAIDLRRALGFSEMAKIDESLHVIAYTQDEKISLLVDRIGEVVELSAQECEATPETVARSFNRMLESIYKLDDRLLLILNVNKVAAAEADMAAGVTSAPRNVQEPYAPFN